MRCFLGAGAVVACDVAHLRPVDGVDPMGDCCRVVPLRVLGADDRVPGMLHRCDVASWVSYGGECTRGRLNTRQSPRASPASHWLVCRGQKQQWGCCGVREYCWGLGRVWYSGRTVFFLLGELGWGRTLVNRRKKEKKRTYLVRPRPLRRRFLPHSFSVAVVPFPAPLLPVASSGRIRTRRR